MSLFDRLKSDAQAEWSAYIDHPFVRGLGDGSLPEDAFRHYLIQDYLFLIQFARAYALAAYKSQTLSDIRAAAEGLKAIIDVEMDLHVALCAKWGLTADDLENTPEAKATLAYTRFVLETGLAGDLLDLHVALSPCVIGYGEIGARLSHSASARSEENSYAFWIAEYGGAEYQKVANNARALIDRLANDRLTEARYPRLLSIFKSATRLESDFWQMGLARAD